MSEPSAEEIRRFVRAKYAAHSTGGSSCGCQASSCCGPAPIDVVAVGQQLGYGAEDLAAVPEQANLGLGCGNPVAIASLQPGQVVLDLGCGAGLDCFLAARRVGPSGRVIGVDMTPEMLSKARESAREGGYANVEFRLGEIEHLPVADASVDVAISNCAINLSPDKPQVFREAYRVLRPGGRLAISDVVARAELPEAIRSDWAMITGCVAGAERIDRVEKMIREAGFQDIHVVPRDESREFIRQWAPGRRVEEYVVSATIEATKPGTAGGVQSFSA